MDPSASCTRTWRRRYTVRPTHVSRYEDDVYIPLLILTPAPFEFCRQDRCDHCDTQLPTFSAADVIAERRTFFSGQSADGRSRQFACWNFRSVDEDIGEEN